MVNLLQRQQKDLINGGGESEEKKSSGGVAEQDPLSLEQLKDIDKVKEDKVGCIQFLFLFCFSFCDTILFEKFCLNLRILIKKTRIHW